VLAQPWPPEIWLFSGALVFCFLHGHHSYPGILHYFLSFNLLATFFKRDGKAQLKSPEEKEVCFLNS